MRKRRLLTEPEAWRVIAEAFFGPETAMTDRGLCSAVRHMRERDTLQSITSEVVNAMVRRLSDTMPVHGGYAYTTVPGGFLCDRSREARNARGMAALWLALDAEDRPND